MTRATRVLALALSTLMLAPALGSAQQAVGPGVEFTAPDKIKWVKNAAGTQETAVLSGDPDKAGPYVIRLRWLPGNMSRPHFHPNDRHFVVVEGTWWLGAGEKYDPRPHRTSRPRHVRLPQSRRDPLRRRQEGTGRHPGLGNGSEHVDSR